MPPRPRLTLAAFLLTSTLAVAQGAPTKPVAPPAWIARSNENAKVLLQTVAD